MMSKKECRQVGAALNTAIVWAGIVAADTLRRDIEVASENPCNAHVVAFWQNHLRIGRKVLDESRAVRDGFTTRGNS
jgi:hypothetical protein